MAERCQICKATTRQGIEFVQLCDLHAHAAEYKAALRGILTFKHLDDCSYMDGTPGTCDCHLVIAEKALEHQQ